MTLHDEPIIIPIHPQPNLADDERIFFIINEAAYGQFLGLVHWNNPDRWYHGKEKGAMSETKKVDFKPKWKQDLSPEDGEILSGCPNVGIVPPQSTEPTLMSFMEACIAHGVDSPEATAIKQAAWEGDDPELYDAIAWAGQIRRGIELSNAARATQPPVTRWLLANPGVCGAAMAAAVIVGCMSLARLLMLLATGN